MLRVLVEATLCLLVCCAVGQNAEDARDLAAYEGLLGHPMFLVKCLQEPSREMLSIRRPEEKRKSAYLRFGRSSQSQLDEEVGKAEKRKSYYMRFGKRSDEKSESVANKTPVASLTETGPVMAKRKSAYIRFGKRNALIALEQPSDAAIVATLKRNMARMRYGRR